MRLRHALGFVVALAVVCAVAWVGQRTVDYQDAVVRAGAAPPGPTVEPSPGVVPKPRKAARGGTDLPAVDPGWAERTAIAAGVPMAAVTAYGRATLLVPESCHLGWTTLAGIGWVESQHGTIDGRVLEPDGRPSEPILGPALDGVGAVAAIPAPGAGAAWHGNTVWDHAVGPMQFISSTWETWGIDGDGDGAADPHDIDDAAYAAARYLCADGHDLSTGEGWSAAVLSYNHAMPYVDAVHHAASTYAARTV